MSQSWRKLNQHVSFSNLRNETNYCYFFQDHAETDEAWKPLVQFHDQFQLLLFTLRDWCEISAAKAPKPKLRICRSVEIEKEMKPHNTKFWSEQHICKLKSAVGLALICPIQACSVTGKALHFKIAVSNWILFYIFSLILNNSDCIILCWKTWHQELRVWLATPEFYEIDTGESVSSNWLSEKN